MHYSELDQILEPFGLRLRGSVELNCAEVADLSIDRPSSPNTKGRLQLVLVGNIGSSMWPFFRFSAEYLDGKPDPLDRWSRRIAQALASDLDVKAVFPFEGPPYYPFQQWAMRAEALVQSPLGLMIHPVYGLWHAYRFGLLISDFEGHKAAVNESPCQSCSDQPCLHSCPVDAFQVASYNVPACAAYLKRDCQSACNTHGCQARLACPVGESYRYGVEQQLFHLRAFVAAR